MGSAARSAHHISKRTALTPPDCCGVSLEKHYPKPYPLRLERVRITLTSVQVWVVNVITWGGKHGKCEKPQRANHRYVGRCVNN